MNIFFKKLSVFLILGIFMAYGLQWLIDKGLRKSGYSPHYQEWYKIMNHQINADIIIQGSSTAKVQVSPRCLQDQFKLSAYNLGVDGATFPVEDYKFNQYIKFNKKPGYIIQVVDAYTITPGNEVDFAQFIPYLNSGLIHNFGDQQIFTNRDLYIPLYKYSHRIGAVTAGFGHLFDKGPQADGTYNGFQAFDFHYDPARIDKILKRSPGGIYAPFNDTIYRQFIDFAAYCKKGNINLTIVYPPAQEIFQKNLKNRDSVTNWYRKISKKYQVNFLDYSGDPMYKDTSLYLDHLHLNAKGVKRFNQLLIKDLKKVIKENPLHNANHTVSPHTDSYLKAIDSTPSKYK